jgi:hypothetical protein
MVVVETALVARALDKMNPLAGPELADSISWMSVAVQG